MGKNLIRKEIYTSDTWTCPAGVTRVRVAAEAWLEDQAGTGRDTAYMIVNGGSLYATGLNDAGQLGNGVDTVNVSSPTAVVGGTLFKSVAGGGKSVLAISADGDAYAWGDNASGQLGVGNVVARSSPTLVSGSKKWRRVAVSRASTSRLAMGIDSNADLYAWGFNLTGALGTGNTTTVSTPTLVVGGKKWLSMTIGQDYGIGITTDGDAYSWGSNQYGELANGTTVGASAGISSPVLVLGGKKWKSISAYGNSVVGVTRDGEAYGWGRNQSGELGIGNVTNVSSPTLVLGGIVWQDVRMGGGGAGNSFAVGIDRNGTAYAWGAQSSGRLGTGGLTTSSPVLVVSAPTNGFRQYALGAGFTIGVGATGAPVAWGSNASGQLGDNSITDRSSPTALVSGFSLGMVLRTEVNAVLIPVTPGVTYNVSALGNPYFGGVTIYADAYNSGAGPQKLVLEYMA